MDVLTDVLERSRARGAGFSHSTLHGEAGVRFPATPGLAVHVVVHGDVHLWAGDPRRAQRLTPGDLVLVRGSLPHEIASRTAASCTPLPEVLASGPMRGTSRRFVVGDTGQEVTASFFCGAYLFEGDLCRGLLDALPETLPMRPPPGSALRATTDLLARELLDEGPGQQAALDRLLDVALVHILREHFATDGSAAPAWFRALQVPGIGAALRAMHAAPERPWTVAELADEASLSRGAFARQFTARLGVPPLTYLTDWRMALARERLRATDDGLAAIALTVGYRSEFSFAAAFKRHHGLSPGRWRARSRAGPVPAG